MDSVKKHFIYRLFFYFFISGIMIGLAGIYLHGINKKIPEHIYINENQQVTVCMGIPAKGEITSDLVDMSVDAMNSSADLSRPLTFVAGGSGHYTLQINLFGFISYRTIDVDVVDEKYVYPGGFQIGMYLHTDGVLVVNTEHIISSGGENMSPWENVIAKGDYIVQVNGQNITEKDELAQAVQGSEGDALNIRLRRSGQIIDTVLQPVKGADEQYKIGLWVKDDAQGIGTVTYLDEANNFAALGHGISDTNTGNIMEISQGRVYRTHVISIVKGKNGTPGELLGAIEYKQFNQIGRIDSNSPNGIHGTVADSVRQEYSLNPMRVGYSYQVHEGEAFVRFYYKGAYKDYQIRIDKITNGQEKNITFQVTSDELLELTNGIVQGMSGCPILQDGNVIGAVTHVFIDDSTKGYGIFIDKML